MTKESKDKVLHLTQIARSVMQVSPLKDETSEYISGFYESQAETMAMLLNRIDVVVRQEDEF